MLGDAFDNAKGGKQTPNTQTPNTQTPNTQTPNTQTPNTQTHKAEEVWRTVQEARLRPAYALRCRGY